MQPGRRAHWSHARVFFLLVEHAKGMSMGRHESQQARWGSRLQSALLTVPAGRSVGGANSKVLKGTGHKPTRSGVR